ncbi:MAG: aminotransferase class III-fold pyridoxal phosphate-dependent enzyme [Oscillospiraceae bacterium]|nr:MAG: aminotransferase class III-fold pyridoxal phosphate-dependent enzyme [Oscillospiraceae bacterium]
MQPDIQALDRQYIAGTYRRFPCGAQAREGSLVYDENEKEYIDLSSGIAVNTFGYADDVWQAAVTAQLGTLQHTSNLYYSEPCAVLASMLCEKTGMSRVFFSNSGAEANECAIKVARKYAQEKKGKEHYHIITLENSFHGRTITTLAATGQAVFHRDFTPLTEGFHHVPAGDLAGVQKLLGAYPTAAVMIEIVQGEGGVIPLDQTFVKELAALLCARDVLLICDEVQIGNGRSGMLYGYMNYDIQPDIFTTAKGWAAGFRSGRCTGERVKDVLTPGTHGSTFGGNPVCCAGAVSVLSRLNEETLAGVRERSAYIVGELTGAPGVRSVTGLGLMLGVETERPAADVIRACMERGVWSSAPKKRCGCCPR